MFLHLLYLVATPLAMKLASEVEIGFAISKRLYGILNILEYETCCSCVCGCLYSCACIDAPVFVDACAHVHVFVR